MAERIKIKGLGGIVLKGNEPKPDTDYLVSITCALEATTKSADGEDTTYIMAYLTTADVQEIGTSNHLKVQQGKTKSQILRHLICSVGKQEGEDVDEYYDRVMDKLIEEYDNKLI